MKLRNQQGLVQAAFTYGEISPSLYGRIDFDGYYKGLRTCRNFIVSKYGGVDNRPGTQFVAPIYDSTKKARLIPFQFNSVQQYVIELGNQTMRIIFNGALLLVGGVPLVVATPWLSSDLPMLKYVQQADIITVTHPSYPITQIKRYSATDWRVETFLNVNGPFQDINADRSIFIATNGVEGNITITSNSSTLFTTDMIGLEFYIKQDPDYSTKAWQVQETVAIGDIRIWGNNYYQAVSAGSTGTVGPDVIEGTVSDGVVTWKYLHSGFGIVRITGQVSPNTVLAVVMSRLPDSIVGTIAGVPRVVNISNVAQAYSIQQEPVPDPGGA